MTGPPGSLAGHRVLVVEGHEDSRDALAVWLRDAGADVWTAADLHDAESQLSTLKPTLVIVDLWPADAAIAWCGSVTAPGSAPAPTVVATTSDGRPGTTDRAFLAGCRVVLVKPYPFEALAVELSSAPPPIMCSSCGAPRPALGVRVAGSTRTSVGFCDLCRRTLTAPRGTVSRRR